MLTATLLDGPVAQVIPDWRRLHARQPGATPFMSPEWAECWWAHYGNDTRPFVWRVTEGERTVGLVPLVLRRRGPLRVIEPLGMEPADYWDLLAEPGRDHEVAAAFTDALVGSDTRWDAWILRCVVPGSPLVGELDARALPAVVRPPIVAPSIELPESFDAYLAGFSATRRSELRKHLRRLDRGEVRLAEISEPDEIAPAIDRWREVRRVQWATAGRQINPEHLSVRFSQFLTEVLQRLGPTGRGVIWEFAVDGRLAGSFVRFMDDTALYSFLGGYHPDFMKLGIGKIAALHGIRSSIERGLSRVDFGRGAEPYKYDLGGVDRPLPARVVGNRRLRSRLALAGARAVLSLRR